MKNDNEWKYFFVTVEQNEQVHLLIRILAPEKANAEVSPQINLCLVIDRSGSMSGEKLHETVQSVKMIIANLKNDDILSVVTFNDDAQTLIPPQKVSVDRAPLLKSVNMIYAEGSTNLSGGLLKGVEHLCQAKTENSINRLLLLSDGCANRGITDDDKLIHLAKSAKQQHEITTTALGFGMAFNEDLLIAMANAATGNFYFIQNVDDAPKMFSNELHGIQSAVAQNITVELKPKSVSKILQVSSHPEYTKEGSLFIELGDACAGEEKRMLLTLSGYDNNKKKELAEMKIIMMEIADDKVVSKSIVQNIFLGGDSTVKGDESPMKLEILQELALQESVKLRKKALNDMKEGIATNNSERVEAAAKRLKAAADKLAALPDDIRTQVIEDEIADLNRQAEALLNAAAAQDGSLTTATIKIRKLTATTTMSIAKSKLKKHFEAGDIKNKVYKKMMKHLDKENPDSKK